MKIVIGVILFFSISFCVWTTENTATRMKRKRETTRKRRIRREHFILSEHFFVCCLANWKQFILSLKCRPLKDETCQWLHICLLFKWCLSLKKNLAQFVILLILSLINNFIIVIWKRKRKKRTTTQQHIFQLMMRLCCTIRKIC